MKLLGFLSIALMLTFILDSCNKNDCDFEIGLGGVIQSTESGTYKDGTHYMGDTTQWAGHSVLICNDPTINLDDYVGKQVTVHANYIHEQDLDVPKLVEVIHVHVE